MPRNYLGSGIQQPIHEYLVPFPGGLSRRFFFDCPEKEKAKPSAIRLFTIGEHPINDLCICQSRLKTAGGSQSRQ